MPNVPPTLRALPLPVADFAVAAVLYELLWPPAGLLLGAIGVLVLGSIVYRISRTAGQYTARAVS